LAKVKDGKQAITVWLPVELHAKIKALADKESRSLANMTLVLLSEATKNK